MGFFTTGVVNECSEKNVCIYLLATEVFRKANETIMLRHTWHGVCVFMVNDTGFFLQISMNAQAVLITVTQKQSVAIQMVHSLALETKDTHSQFLCKVCTFSFKSLHPKTHHVFLFAMRCLNNRVKLPQKTICLSTYPIFVPISCCAHTTCLN